MNAPLERKSGFTLIDVNPENEAKFKEVTRFLEEDLQQQGAADSPD